MSSDIYAKVDSSKKVRRDREMQEDKAEWQEMEVDIYESTDTIRDDHISFQSNEGVYSEKEQLQIINDKLKNISVCPGGWKRFGRNCYFKSNEKKNWYESRKYCENKGAHLVIINDKEEQFLHTTEIDLSMNPKFTGKYTASLMTLLFLSPRISDILERAAEKKSRPSDNKDYRPVALTSHIMKVLERLILPHIRTSVAPHMDTLQFTYQPNISVDDALIYMLHRTYTHLDTPDASVRFIFFDFTSAFNTIRPGLLGEKMRRMEVDASLVQ
ncbi:hypothetical protein L3Q82_003213 [Scortum barcoo]|uniref:Uncharacterized protein n=1 Tax=Scortum barcoo TaxID=214431 RepID=A0ACB8VRX3_9TELE|nr:hypothetical protein L3Q82_003213 [Scortum barcoo]